MSTKRCLLTGADGFIGANLRRELADDKKIQIIAIDRRSMDLRQASQVHDVIAAQEPEIIVNFAGISSPANDDIWNMYQVNALGHLHIIQAAAALKRKPTVILASSAQLYGPGVLGKATEETPLNPVNHYGLSKLLAEKYCELFAEGVPTVIARLYNTIGHGQSLRFVIPKIVAAFRERRPRVEIGSLDVERDFIDVRDLIAIWRLILLSDKPPSIVNVSNGETATLQQIISRLSKITGHHIDVVSSASMVRKHDIPYQCGDNTIVRGMGYRRQYSLDETLKWMLEG